MSEKSDIFQRRGRIKIDRFMLEDDPLAFEGLFGRLIVYDIKHDVVMHTIEYSCMCRMFDLLKDHEDPPFYTVTVHTFTGNPNAYVFTRQH